MQKKNRRPGETRTVTLLAAIAVLVAISALFSPAVAFGELLLLLLIVLYYTVLAVGRKGRLGHYLDTLMNDLSVATRRSLLDVPLPVTILRKTGEILWANDKFGEIAGTSAIFGRRIEDFSRNFNIRAVDKEKLYEGFDAEIGEHLFRVYGIFAKTEQGGEQMLVLYWTDQTALRESVERYEQTRPAVAIVMIDSFDEIVQTLSENDKATLVSRVENYVAAWTAEAHGVFRAIDRGKYLFICEKQYLDQYIAAKFDILDSVRDITLQNRMPISISIGFGVDGATLEENHEFAKQAIDMALGRGGDQAVIKTRNNFEFFGGKSKTVEKAHQGQGARHGGGAVRAARPLLQCNCDGA